MLKLDRKSAEAILKVCIKYYGKSKYTNILPFIKIFKHSKYYTKKIKTGHYANNVISIYIKNIESVEELIKTIIHEYHHYLSDPNEYELLLEELKQKGYNKSDCYNLHPHEQFCHKAENDYKIIESFLIK